MRYPGDEDGIGADEQQLADLLKRAVPEPPRQLTYEEITVRNVERTVKSWLVPTLAAASVLIVAGAVGAVAATRSDQTASGTPAANQHGKHAGPATPSARPSSPGCQPSPVPTASAARAGRVAVPSVVGQGGTTAEQVIQSAGLIVILHETTSKTAPAGIVLSESPAAGTQVPTGAAVTLTASAGSPGAQPTPTRAPGAQAAKSPTPMPMPTSSCPTPAPVPGQPTAVPTAGSGGPGAVPSAVPTVGAPGAAATPSPASSANAVPTAAPTARPTPRAAAPTPAPSGKSGAVPTPAPTA
jgi:hypothetical protein